MTKTDELMQIAFHVRNGDMGEDELRAAIEQAMEAARADGFAWGMKAALDENCAAQPQPELTDAKLDDIYLKVVGPKGGKLSRAYARAVIAADRAKETK